MPLSDFARARDSDPWTSHAAADQVAKRQHFDRILETLMKHGALGKDGIARHSGLDPNQISRRLPEMEKLFLVRPTGKIVKSKANRDEREWDIYG